MRWGVIPFFHQKPMKEWNRDVQRARGDVRRLMELQTAVEGVIGANQQNETTIYKISKIARLRDIMKERGT